MTKAERIRSLATRYPTMTDAMIAERLGANLSYVSTVRNGRKAAKPVTPRRMRGESGSSFKERFEDNSTSAKEAMEFLFTDHESPLVALNISKGALYPSDIYRYEGHDERVLDFLTVGQFKYQRRVYHHAVRCLKRVFEEHLQMAAPLPDVEDVKGRMMEVGGIRYIHKILAELGKEMR